MLSRSEEKLVRGLARRRVREREGAFLVEGVRGVESLLDAGLAVRLALLTSALTETERGRALAARLRGSVTVRDVAPAVLRELADTETPQGVLAVAEAPGHRLAELDPAGASVGLVLDGVQDPGNLGALVRTASAFGAEFAAVLPGTVDPWNAKAVRAAAGGLFRLPVVRPSVDALLEWTRRHGYTLYGSAADGVPVDTVQPTQRSILVVGNEGTGIGPELSAAVTGHLAVPMRRRTDSLNVAVAGGILLYVLTRGCGGA